MLLARDHSDLGFYYTKGDMLKVRREMVISYTISIKCARVAAKRCTEGLASDIA